MKFRVLGGPVKGTVIVEGKHSDKFEKLFKKIEKELGKGLWDTFQVFPATILEGTRKAVPIPTVIDGNDTPDKLNLVEDKKSGLPVLLMLREKSAAMPPPLEEYAREAEQSRSAQVSVTPSRSEPPASSDHTAQPDSALVTPATTPRELDSTHEQSQRDVNTGASYHDRLVAIYTLYEPSKLHTVNGTLKKFKGREEAVISQLTKKYGPEPPVTPQADSSTATPSAPPAPQAAEPAQATPTETVAAPAAASPPVVAAPVVSPTPPMADSSPTSPTADNASLTNSTSSPAPQAPNGSGAPPSYHDRLTALYAAYDPAKVKLVEGTLRKFKGKEEAVIRQLVKKYGPEPPSVQATAAPQAAVGANDVYRDAIKEILLKYDPDNVHMVDPLLERYAGQEETIVKRLLDKYENAPAASVAPAAPSSPPEAVSTPPQPESAAVAEEAPGPQPTQGQVDTDAQAERDAAVPLAETTQQPETAAEEEGSLVTATLTPLVESPATVSEEVEADEAEEVLPVGAEAQKTAPPSPNAEPAGVPPREESDVALPPPAVEVQMVPKSTVIASHDIVRVESPPARSLEAAEVSAETQQSVTPAVKMVDECSAPQTPLVPENAGPPVTVTESISPTVISPCAAQKTVPRTPHNSPVVAHRMFPPSAFHPSAVAIGPLITPEAVRACRANAAAAAKCGGVMAAAQSKALRTVYWHKWSRYQFERAAEGALERREWVMQSSNGAPSYRLNDPVSPPFVVPDLATYKEQQSAGGFSDSVLIGLRVLIASLVQAFQAQVVDVSTPEDEAMLEAFIRTWQEPANLCPVRDTPELARALHQAAQLLSQLDDLMSVTKTQSEQLRELKSMHEQLSEQLEAQQEHEDTDRTARAESSTASSRVTELQAALAERDSSVKQLKAQILSQQREIEQLKNDKDAAAVRDATSARTPRTPRAGGSASASSPPASGTLRKQLAMTEREVESKDAQIVQLQQELAKARTILHRSREKNEQLQQDLRTSMATEERLRRDLLGARATRMSPMRSPRAGRAHSAGRGVTVPPATFSAPVFRNERTSSNHPSPRHPRAGSPSLSAIRHPTQSAERQDHSADASRLYQLAGGAPSSGREASWPRSRYVPPPTDVERGPCPNCLSPLVSCSPSFSGPAEETAAFCFSCRRAFTFGDLLVRDKIADMGQL